MSLDTQIQNLAVRAATQDKLLKTLINGNAIDLSALTTTDKSNLVAAINEVLGKTTSLINDNASSTTTTYSSDKITAEIQAAVTNLVASSPAALDTLNELATAIGNDANFATTITNALANKLDFGTAQTLTAAQLQQGQDNLQVYSRTEIGSVSTNYVTIFEANL